MKYEAGNRFTPETYLKTEAESGTSVSLKVTGELEGVEVSFDSGDVPEITSLSVTENGTYEAPEGTAYDPVTVEVPNTYTAADEGKVVSSGALVAQTSTTKTANGTYDTTLNNEVVVDVANSYTAADEGKVVDQGALVAQTSTTKTANGTYDTTLNNEVVVNVPSSGDATFKAIIERSISGTLEIPGGITKIGDYVFYNYFSLTKVIIPEGVTMIGSNSFQGCANQTSFEVDCPSTITNMGSNSFRSLTLSNVIIRATAPPSLGSAFSAATVNNIYVPSESVEDYKAASGWSTYASVIQAIPTT